ncbi:MULTISPECIES: hypothetical protein [unclassified Cetobacterium]|uniref:hypothetical protein n=1 Tax=unclassified Cetobacterium TaxID=2630983 RepID=UPI00163BEF33|nr:hypothetical protein [Cetobacterium sp. 8H]MBC2850278.1 hypothetical protein [Cetobacterium sp. 8H]
MKNVFLASLFFSLFFVGCSSSEPKEEPVVVEEAVVVEPVEMGKEIMPKPTLDK